MTVKLYMYVLTHFVFQMVTQGNVTVYQVYYNGTSMNVSSSITTLTFNAPLLLNGVFTGNVVVKVNAFSRYGIGQASDPETAQITGM